ncbi:MAG: hypothetical protein DRJ40_09680 [Thermoprotei archaeon]|nr:MAG: hypothetical protein DRJ40_09680 [Thermoprotei archaeon]
MLSLVLKLLSCMLHVRYEDRLSVNTHPVLRILYIVSTMLIAVVSNDLRVLVYLLSVVLVLSIIGDVVRQVLYSLVISSIPLTFVTVVITVLEFGDVPTLMQRLGAVWLRAFVLTTSTILLVNLVKPRELVTLGKFLRVPKWVTLSYVLSLRLIPQVLDMMYELVKIHRPRKLRDYVDVLSLAVLLMVRTGEEMTEQLILRYASYGEYVMVNRGTTIGNLTLIAVTALTITLYITTSFIPPF